MPTPPKTPPKPRTSSRSSRVRTPLLRFERLSRLWQRSRLAKFFLSIAALILLYIISYPIYQIAHHYQRVSIETKDYTTLSTTLKTLKPKLESVSPQGTVWEIEEYCEYGRVVFGRGERACMSHLVATVHAKSSSIEFVSAIESQVRSSKFAVVKEYIQRDNFQLGQQGGAAGYNYELIGTDMTGCGSYYEIIGDKIIDVSIGCSGSVVKEYYPLRHF